MWVLQGVAAEAQMKDGKCQITGCSSGDHDHMILTLVGKLALP